MGMHAQEWFRMVGGREEGCAGGGANQKGRG